MKLAFRSVSLLFALVLAAAVPAFAQEVPQQPNRFAASIAPAERFDVKGMLVERHGSSGRPLILIPGLATGGWVWQETVRAFSKEHAVYVVTLPGFDGRPAVAGDPFDAARSALKELVVARKLVKPVLVGHSLGGTLAIALAEDLGERIGGAVAIDGLAVMPRTEGMPPDQRAAMADNMRQRMASLSPQAFASQQQQYMRTIGVIDMDKADDLARLTARSDPAAVAAYMGAVLARDLRPGLPAIRAPLLMIVPTYGPDNAAMGVSGPDKVSYYRELMTGTPKLDVTTIDNARHFAMLDQPAAVNDALRTFLKTL
ncbi:MULTISPECIES: alpha/beta fold hydrolase [unclassified Massilia]|uniref:alpha/beta fold hydrolase n=1 Tax=unclassified Massilia TaxID=2609279 RepID=UPI001784177A|nr:MULTISPECIES: alpha/beta hydrolase [unclassified Massilia]MBD8531843.1 alpha/beta hydrolase [Massilia sp. CFBP 13647]MBD8675288.1 alpha/beta hydrolase [Massilia sp. CFBP 13721]